MSKTHNTAPTQFIEAGGVRYAYRRFGSGPGLPLICLQHFRGGLDNWDPQVTDGLAKGRSVILFNNAGVASSSGEPADTIDGMARHVIAFAEALGLQRFDLLGFYTGGFVAQRLALDRPDLLRRMILAGTGPEGGEGMVGYPELATFHATREVPIEEDFLYLFFSPTETSQAAGRAFWERRHARADQDPASSLTAMAAQAKAINTWGAVTEHARYASLKDIELPVLVVNGKTDVMVPTVNSFILQQHLPNAELVLYPDSGHGAIFQFPDQFVRDVRQFLDG
ncbi:alpha/beta hydrolase [Phenylobacterium sp.]|uniref:alpha/beta fold hydrolase n=1 Tax=Phenylobacterium sp. TaxID=1871053 RepID=UPI001217DD42|nr:alpha/beta hydrolase [Phenylobacterium sp.]THD64459.1 MAG: alpha/beta hydrolase [Phenylobacterium sp.]